MSGQAQHAGPVRDALREVTVGHGPGVLNDRAALGPLLADLLPDSPQLRRVLLHAASAGTTAALGDYAEQSMDAGTAVRLAAAALRDRTLIDAEVCLLVTTEIAVALDYPGAADLDSEAAGMPAGPAIASMPAAGDAVRHAPPVAPTLPSRRNQRLLPVRPHRRPKRVSAARSAHRLLLASSLLLATTAVTIVIVIVTTAHPRRTAQAPVLCPGMTPCTIKISAVPDGLLVAPNGRVLYVADIHGRQLP